MTRGIVPVLVTVALLSGCDDMTVQHKAELYSAQAARIRPAPGAVQWQDKPPRPPPLTLALLQRGQERYGIYCTPCHSELGDGNGMVVQRGFPHPPSYLEESLVNAPTQHFYDVITDGHGAMYSFAGRVAPQDRWAIAAYVRALQLSQHAAAADLPPEQRQALP